MSAKSVSVVALLSIIAGPLAACTSTPSPSSRTAAVLGTAGSFTVLGGSTVTNTGPTTIVGDVGVNPGLAVTGFPPGMVTGGVLHAGDAVSLQAQSDVTAAYIVLAGAACDEDLTGQDLGGMTLIPGVYCFSSSAQLTGQLTLDALGNPDSVFVFQIGSTLTTASDSSVLVINGAQGCNAYWQVGSSATLGTTSTFVGSILALTSITLTTGAQVHGRALARNGAVTMDNNHLEVGTCVTGGGEGADAGVEHTGCVECGDSLVDLQTDFANCGACGNYCNWDLQCVAGACTCAETVCGDICVNVDLNPENCGACGVVCGDDQWCDDGACSTVCAGTICDSWCTDTLTNPDACGACGNVCGADEICTAGVCECTATMCGLECVDLQTSPSDCGTCGTVCAETECCTDGECTPL